MWVLRLWFGRCGGSRERFAHTHTHTHTHTTISHFLNNSPLFLKYTHKHTHTHTHTHNGKLLMQLNNSYPDTFHSACSDLDNCHGSFVDLVVIPTVAYFVMWTVPYSMLIFVIQAKKIKENHYETMFSYYKDFLFGKTKMGEFQKQVAYMTIHFLLCSASFLIAWGVWQHFWIHTIYLVGLIHVSIYNGATFYFSVCMNPEKILKQLNLAASTAAAAAAQIQPSVVVSKEADAVARAATGSGGSGAASSSVPKGKSDDNNHKKESSSKKKN